MAPCDHKLNVESTFEPFRDANGFEPFRDANGFRYWLPEEDRYNQKIVGSV